MIERAPLIDLYQISAELLKAFEADRASLFEACAVGSDPDSLDPDARAVIEEMDALISAAKQALDNAREVLDV